jgi:hypothetical protein
MECCVLNHTRAAPLTLVILLRKKLFITTLLGVVWLACVVFGIRVLLRYESTPGRIGVVGGNWPVVSAIPRTGEHPTLVMFAHPHCPCTRASIGELAQIVADTGGKLNACVLFIKPKAASADWDDTELRRSAAAIPGVRVFTDAEGSEARRFGAETSGHTLLFDRTGALLFSGGITASRGHAGRNDGESAIIAAVNGKQSARERTPVFGCSLTSQPGEGVVCLN